MGSRWCARCQRDAVLIRPPICPICGVTSSQDIVCHTCRIHPPEYSALRSWGVFTGPLQKALHRLKYRRDIALGESLAKNMLSCLQEQSWHLDVVVPVPLGIARLAERGYNQAALLAMPIALASRLRYSTKALQRVRETRSQVGLSLEERWVNVENSFAANPVLIEGKIVLVVDDVATSGATLNACASALRCAGAAQVFALTLARAL
jgi:ComF family protein